MGCPEYIDTLSTISICKGKPVILIGSKAHSALSSFPAESIPTGGHIPGTALKSLHTPSGWSQTVTSLLMVYLMVPEAEKSRIKMVPSAAGSQNGLFGVFETVFLCESDCPGIHYVKQSGLKSLTIVLPLPHEYWDYGPGLPRSTQTPSQGHWSPS